MHRHLLGDFGDSRDGDNKSQLFPSQSPTRTPLSDNRPKNIKILKNTWREYKNNPMRPEKKCGYSRSPPPK